ncbi:MucBP domain-containing protein, partial [Aerococcaceae bacterium zg-ZUI334]|uniref:MucBP domain-containing protein n=1 Tax=Aerococcaceae bacterium zg-252 TaxID=2796928 RepID=UPI001B93EF9E|nr:MucBP domain-containing protein [Aerococcaceae bacterium zg-ZUI334]
MFFNKKQRFSIRKYKIGVCSVLLGTTIVMGANQVSAEEVGSSEPVTSTSELVDDQPLEEEPTTVSEETVAPAQETETTTEETTEVAAPAIEEVTEAPTTEAATEATPVAEVAPATEVEATEEVAADVNIEAVKAEKIELINTYSALTPEVRNEYVSRLQEAVDAAALEQIAREARRAQRRAEAFPNEGQAIPTGTGFRADTVTAEPTESTYTGRMVSPEVEITPNVSSTGNPPTAYNRSTFKLKFGDQKLHEGDYFFVETENVAIEFPSKYYVEVDGKMYVIANVEKSGYESDIMKATDINDPSRFDMKLSNDLLTSRRKYKVTFTKDVEGLTQVEAGMTYSIAKETIFATEDRESTFKVIINDTQKYETTYTIPAFNEVSRHIGNTVVNEPYRSFDLTTWDYRPQGANRTPEALAEIGFFKDLTADGFGTLVGQLQGAPEGFKLTLKSNITPGQPGAFTWPADKMRVGQKLPVKWAPYSQNGQRQANSNDGKLYVTPDNMYYIIESISADGRSITLNFFGDYSKPGYLTLGALNLDEDMELGKSSRLVVKYDVDTPLTGAKETVDFTYIDKKTNTDPGLGANSTGKRGNMTGLSNAYDFTSVARGVPVKPANPEQLGKGTVIVHYVNTDGTVIQDQKDVVRDVEVDSSYDASTPEFKPATIEHEGKTYKLVEQPGSYPVGVVGTNKNLIEDAADNENISMSDPTGVAPTGQVKQGTRDVTYVYEMVKGDVNVTYKDTEGNIIKFIKDDKVIGENGQSVADKQPVGDAYNTETPDFKPETITSVDGKTYRLVPQGNYNVGDVDEKGHLTSSAPVDGKVTEKLQTITYIYEEVKGDVKVHYVDETGKKIKESIEDTATSVVGTPYDTRDNVNPTNVDTKPQEIVTEDGKTYTFVRVSNSNEVGDNKAVVENVTETNRVTDDEKDEVQEGTTNIIYVYKEVKGNVDVEYVDTKGNKITFVEGDTTVPGAKSVAKDESTGTDYVTNNETLRPTELKTPTGETYRLVPQGTYPVGTVDENGHKEGSADVDGKVKKEPQTVTYVYEKVAGNVDVHFVDEDGNVLSPKENDTTDGNIDSTYNTEDHKKQTITTTDGKVYELTRVSDSNTVGSTKVVPDGSIVGAEDGSVVEGTTNVIYVYKLKEEAPKGSVIVNYVDVDGNFLKDEDTIFDTKEGKDGEAYDTVVDLRPDTITKDGKTYKLVEKPGVYPVGTVDADKHLEGTDSITGSVEAGKTKKVTYVYEEVKPVVPGGEVSAQYFVEGEETRLYKDPTVEEDTVVKEQGTPLETTYKDVPPAILTDKDGNIYDLVKKEGNTPKLKEGSAPQEGNVTETPQVIKYEYKKRETPKEEPKGSVVVHYVNEAGEVIKTEYNDTTNAAVDAPFNTADNELEKPKEITFGGKTYVFKEVSMTPKVGQNDVVKEDATNRVFFLGKETGEVVEGTTHVIYVYSEKQPEENPVKPGGEVTAQYYVEGTEERLYEDPTVEKDTVVKEKNTPLETPYEDTPPVVLTDKDGNIYDLVKNEDGTPKLKEGSAEPTGEVTETPQVIKYEYKKRETPKEEPVKPGGEVTAQYYVEGTEERLYEDPTVEKDTVVKEKNTPLETPYEDTPPVVLTDKDGNIYDLVKNEDGTPKLKEGSAEPTGEVTETPQVIKYEYKKRVTKGSVIVNYVDELGDKIEDHTENVAVLINADAETDYDTTTETLRPKTLVTTSGKVYELVPVGKYEAGEVDGNGRLTDTDEAAGKVEAGKTKEITYVYKLKEELKPAAEKGSVIVNYVDELGDKIEDHTENVAVLINADAETGYDTTTETL